MLTPLFPQDRLGVIAMIHLAALPGAPQSSLSVREIARRAAEEALLLADCGVDALLIENMHDTPYLRSEVGPEIVAAMTACALSVRAAVPHLTCGVQVLAAANDAAMAVALAAGLDFVRVEGFVFAHIADEGMIEGCAGTLLRQRRAWGASRIKVFADIKKKHSSHAITADVDIAETARAAQFFGAEGVIVSGTSTGAPIALADLTAAAKATDLPVLIGSGVDTENLANYAELAAAVIVGSSIKRDGDWRNEPEAKRVMALVEAAASIGSGKGS
jgi:membrane complex biogenesis BtpA family protein